MKMETAEKNEYAAWTKVCKLLEKSGAVTKADLKSRRSDRNTEGQTLLHAIRRWGDGVVKLTLKVGK